MSYGGEVVERKKLSNDEVVVGELRTVKPKTSVQFGQVVEKAISEQGMAIPAEVVQELSRLVFNDLGATLTSGVWLLRYEGKKRLKSARSEREIREIRTSMASIPKPRKHSIDKIPGSFATRVFVGGAYDDLPTLREIGKHVKRRGYVPIVPYDFELPRANADPLLDIHDMDILLLHNCRVAIFELSLAAGQYNEVEWSIRQFRKKTLGLCKARESGKLPDLVSTMVVDLFRQSNQPLEPYADFTELKHSVAGFLEV
jgi:hypothetical protein